MTTLVETEDVHYESIEDLDDTTVGVMWTNRDDEVRGDALFDVRRIRRALLAFDDEFGDTTAEVALVECADCDHDRALLALVPHGGGSKAIVIAPRLDDDTGSCRTGADELVTDGGEVVDDDLGGSAMTWDGEDCPQGDCDGELQQQDRFNVMCLACEEVWTHVKTQEKHYLQTVDFEMVASMRRVATDGGEVVDDPPVELGEEPVADMDLADLREQYLELAKALHGQSYAGSEWEDTAYRRQSEMWSELLARSEAVQPKCPHCGSRDWGQVPGEPVHCNGCGLECSNTEVEERVHEAWDEILGTGGDEA